MQTDFQDAIKSQECLSCGITFAITATFERHLRSTRRQFNCPNGHLQNYSDRLEVDKLKERIVELEGIVAARDVRLGFRQDDIDSLKRECSSLRGVITKLKKKMELCAAKRGVELKEG